MWYDICIITNRSEPNVTDYKFILKAISNSISNYIHYQKLVIPNLLQGVWDPFLGSMILKPKEVGSKPLEHKPFEIAKINKT